MVFLACGCGGKKKKSRKVSPKNSVNQYSKSKPLLSSNLRSRSRNGNADSPIAISPPAIATLRIRTIDFPEAPITTRTPNESPIIAAVPVENKLPSKPEPSKPDSVGKVSETLHENREMVKKALDITPAEAEVKRNSHMIKNPYEMQQQEAAFAAMRGEAPKLQSFFPSLRGSEVGEGGKNPLQEQFNSELESKMKLRATAPKADGAPAPAPAAAIKTDGVTVLTAPPLPTTMTAAVPLPPPVSVDKSKKASTVAPATAPSATAPSVKANRPPVKASAQPLKASQDKNPARGTGTPRPQRPVADPNKHTNRNVVSSYRTGTVTSKWTTEYGGTIKNIRDKKKERNSLVSIEEFNRELEEKLKKRSIYLENTAKANGVRVF